MRAFSWGGFENSWGRCCALRLACWLGLGLALGLGLGLGAGVGLGLDGRGATLAGAGLGVGWANSTKPKRAEALNTFFFETSLEAKLPKTSVKFGREASQILFRSLA